MKTAIICVDFDGVLNTYTGWRGDSELYVPRDGAKEFLDELNKKYVVYIFTTRDKYKVIDWLDKYGLEYDDVTNSKIGALCYIDDRAIQFNGDYQEVLKELSDFKTYWE